MVITLSRTTFHPLLSLLAVLLTIFCLWQQASSSSSAADFDVPGVELSQPSADTQGSNGMDKDSIPPHVVPPPLATAGSHLVNDAFTSPLWSESPHIRPPIA